jgi:hypothetical protein
VLCVDVVAECCVGFTDVSTVTFTVSNLQTFSWECDESKAKPGLGEQSNSSLQVEKHWHKA